jgi:hypothetical protein
VPDCKENGQEGVHGPFRSEPMRIRNHLGVVVTRREGREKRSSDQWKIQANGLQIGKTEKRVRHESNTCVIETSFAQGRLRPILPIVTLASQRSMHQNTCEVLLKRPHKHRLHSPVNALHKSAAAWPEHSSYSIKYFSVSSDQNIFQ